MSIPLPISRQTTWGAAMGMSKSDIDQSNARVRQTGGGIPRLLEIMSRLRDPDHGCPWDIEQDFSTIAPYTLEEAYEVLEAIEANDMENLRGELGDLLLQVVYHAQMASEAGHFGFEDVVEAISTKMIDRHPHVFGDESRNKTAEDQSRDWEKLKAAERAKAQSNSVLDGVAITLPALTRAIKLQNRAARVGFDWPHVDQVVDKLLEEAQELSQATDPVHVEEEFGDLAFVMANLARHLGIDAEAALRKANQKFTRRFQGIEDALAARGESFSDVSLADMDEIWDDLKRAEKARQHQP